MAGINTEFARIPRDTSGLDAAIRAFLSRGYAFKRIADHAFDPDMIAAPEQAVGAIASGTRFVSHVHPGLAGKA